MRAITFIILALLVVTATAQKSPVEKFIKKNAYEGGISVQEIDPNSTETSPEASSEGMSFKDVATNFDNIMIIQCDPEMTSEKTRADFYTKASDALDNDKYIELVSIHDNDEAFDIFVYQKKPEIVNEIVSLIKDGEEVSMLYIKCDIDLKTFDLQPLINAMASNKSCGKN